MMDEAEIAQRIAGERAARRWSLAALADRSKVSRAMLSKIERQEASPTATVLLRIAAAFGLTLAELLTPDASGGGRLARAEDQAAWTDPATGYLRRQVYLSPTLPMELVEIRLPPRTQVAAPAASYALIRQVLWVLEGAISIIEGDQASLLRAGDRLEFGPASDVLFQNNEDIPSRYLVAVLRC